MRTFFLIFICFYSIQISKCFSQNIIYSNYGIETPKGFKKDVYEIKIPQYFNYSGFSITDSLNNENRYAKKIDKDSVIFFDFYCLKEKEVYKIENALTEIKSSLAILNNKIKNKNISLSRNLNSYYRQYNAYMINKDSVCIKIFFCTKSFFENHKYFRYVFLPSIVVREMGKPPLYYCSIITDIDFNKITLLSFDKYF